MLTYIKVICNLLGYLPPLTRKCNFKVNPKMHSLWQRFIIWFCIATLLTKLSIQKNSKNFLAHVRFNIFINGFIQMNSLATVILQNRTVPVGRTTTASGNGSDQQLTVLHTMVHHQAPSLSLPSWPTLLLSNQNQPPFHWSHRCSTFPQMCHASASTTT